LNQNNLYDTEIKSDNERKRRGGFRHIYPRSANTTRCDPTVIARVSDAGFVASSALQGVSCGQHGVPTASSRVRAGYRGREGRRSFRVPSIQRIRPIKCSETGGFLPRPIACLPPKPIAIDIWHCAFLILVLNFWLKRII